MKVVAASASLTCGCGLTTQLGHARDPCCVVYYLDGAGGGGLVPNWGWGVHRGMRAAGYTGEFVNFAWQTGLGAPVDQDSSVGYKRAKGKELADTIARYSKGDTAKDVSLVGLSAGTAVAVYALEALPRDCEVQDVVLLGSSISAQYDLTRALRHVRDGFYVFTSDRDEILSSFVPMLGTADREFCGLCAAGLHGFRLPPGASAETRRLYSTKIRHIPWRPEFERDGNQGSHFDYTDSTFVRNRIAPLLLHQHPAVTRVAAARAQRPASQPAATQPRMD